MGEVDVGFVFDAGEVVARVVVVSGEPVAAAATVGVDESGDAAASADAFQVAINAGRRLFRQRIGAREEEDLMVRDGPDLRMLRDEVQACAQVAQVVEEVLTDVAEDFPQRLTRLET